MLQSSAQTAITELLGILGFVLALCILGGFFALSLNSLKRGGVRSWAGYVGAVFIIIAYMCSAATSQNPPDFSLKFNAFELVTIAVLIGGVVAFLPLFALLRTLVFLDAPEVIWGLITLGVSLFALFGFYFLFTNVAFANFISSFSLGLAFAFPFRFLVYGEP